MAHQLCGHCHDHALRAHSEPGCWPEHPPINELTSPGTRRVYYIDEKGVSPLCELYVNWFSAGLGIDHSDSEPQVAQWRARKNGWNGSTVWPAMGSTPKNGRASTHFTLWTQIRTIIHKIYLGSHRNISYICTTQDWTLLVKRGHFCLNFYFLFSFWKSYVFLCFISYTHQRIILVKQ